MKNVLWTHLPCNDEDAKALVAALGLHPTVARLLCMRGLSDPDLAARFLNPSMDHLHDPWLLADMGKAVARIERAIAAKERIAIHGDYVDGISHGDPAARARDVGADVVRFNPPPRRLRPPAAAIDLLRRGAMIVSVVRRRGTEAARAREPASISSRTITSRTDAAPALIIHRKRTLSSWTGASPASGSR
jgi:hypothetical protein